MASTEDLQERYEKTNTGDYVQTPNGVQRFCGFDRQTKDVHTADDDKIIHYWTPEEVNPLQRSEPDFSDDMA